MSSGHHRITLLSLIDPKLIPAIDLWHLDLSHITSQDREDALAHLAPQELVRSDRYRCKQDQQHFILRRMLLKKILALYGNVHPRDIQVKEDHRKKPRVVDASDLKFNSSHTPTRGIVAIHPNHSVGVDIEQISAIDDQGSLLELFASLEEKRWVHNSTNRFFMLWTIKEALLKCKGTGFLVERVPVLEQTPEQLQENVYVSRSQGYIIYSTLWERCWLSICRMISFR